ncbi:MAG TPA: DNA repair protein RecN [Pyrinomonadaceae bacterium]|jgi:DNA repair protein RecN (Recombination protein N)
MLKSINISNFAVIDRLQVDFQEGLNLLTGETGSGKSIIVDALGLVLGGRSSAAQIRTGERLAVIEGAFEVAPEIEGFVLEVLATAAIERERGEELNIRREISASGKSRIFINDQMATAAALRALQPYLVEIHGQGEQRSLLSAQSHLRLLDSYSGCASLRGEVGEAFVRWKNASRALEMVERELADRERAEDLLRYQLAEIKGVAPVMGEDEALAAEKIVLTHAEKIMQLGTSAYAELYESDESVLSRLAGIRRRLEELSEIDARILPLKGTLEAGIVSLMDVAEELRGYGEGIEFSPARLAQIENRLADLERLKRKYNASLQGILDIQLELMGKLNRLGDLSEREVTQREALASARSDYIELAERLTACRKKGAPELAERVMADLRHVAMEQARFIVRVETSAAPTFQTATARQEGYEEASADPDDQSVRAFFSPHGADRVEFLLSANPGESPRPLGRVASGGELSRLMLTLRTISMSGEEERAQGATTVVFDEIDVGIGGRVAEAVGRRLKALSAKRQVLCVTHQPQIARFARQHYVVDKSIENGRTVTSVKSLDREERVIELARMIGGAVDAESTREAARWLLEKASQGEGEGRERRAKKSQRAQAVKIHAKK